MIYIFILFIGIVSGLITLFILRKFTVKYDGVLKEAIANDVKFKRNVYNKGLRRDHSYLFLGDNAIALLAVNLIAAILLSLILSITKDQAMLIWIAITALIPAIFVELFVFRNKLDDDYELKDSLRRHYNRRLRRALYFTSLIPIVISLFINW